ncbi:MAG: hypothetical protein ABSA92_12160 [Candidatus Bathyarchaeia archaeon]|jgi:hypothetical protein
MSKIPDAILIMLNAADTPAAVFPPTILYNESWMLRLALSASAEGISCLPFSFLKGAKWFAEGELPSPFHSRSQSDPLAETRTRADGVVGHFTFASMTKTGLLLEKDAKQFVVLEAKMYSPLRRGTKNAPSYDQAARTVACMAKTIEQAEKPIEDLTSVGFYVVAPVDRIENEVFAEQMKRQSIENKVRSRMDDFEKSDTQSDFKKYREVFDELVQRIDLRCWSWEETVKAITTARPSQSDIIKRFYKQCQDYNRRPPASSHQFQGDIE